MYSEHDPRVLYRHYATLYFVFCVDSSESELGILDLIQVFVETLDKCFENVCELDLIFHMDTVQFILNELVMGGMVLETNMTEIMLRVEEQNKIEKEEVQFKQFIYTTPNKPDPVTGCYDKTVRYSLDFLLYSHSNSICLEPEIVTLKADLVLLSSHIFRNRVKLKSTDKSCHCRLVSLLPPLGQYRLSRV